MTKKKPKPFPKPPDAVEIASLTPEGRGLAQVDGKSVFLHGALPGERVRFRYTRLRKDRAEGTVEEVLRAAPERVPTPCPHADICGGCSLQHLDPAAQIRWKQEMLERVLAETGQVRPERRLPPLIAAPWGYRRKARLGVRYVAKKGRTLVGFRERGTSYIADLRRCDILHPTVGERIEAIAKLLDGLSIRQRIPQIEMAMGEGPCVLVLRVLEPPSARDVARLTDFGETCGLHFYVQAGGAETIRPLLGQGVDLYYDLPGADVRLYFQPTDFTQVNPGLNRMMVEQALVLLAPRSDERILDLFCGLGNFTLPIARRAAEVLGVEGDPGLVARARTNAEHNGITNARFVAADLYARSDPQPWASQRFHKALLDPPRSGALQVLELLPAIGVGRILYVSCYPATLARDADRLVNGLGYRLRAVGMLDMFPHTAHLEAMAVFERG
ncbi:23S rRNA (uracil(1939)-C(5))-methyltransferase RlmD [Candidatus Thiosymbion oneisti]|uniref:23S rRNA (uracil(1939)-C(5))-methyltransferase RlmD n=1 Tax=Candidatus Thiosymbion oneisti TaxID=589554 RepID=UPI000B29DD1C|nr:23S rRNA (uracil(1939)-C(5))-methyltransferase RlmD [Candidatus Thiosymbion oneisti]